MNSPPTTQTKIIRTERGLTISGARITLYDVMDYVTISYPPKLIREKLFYLPYRRALSKACYRSIAYGFLDLVDRPYSKLAIARSPQIFTKIFDISEQLCYTS